MKNGAEYIVTTRWGTFSLDEASYRDYLEGKLWISWNQGKTKEQKPDPNTVMPPNVTDRAIYLRDRADKIGVLDTLRQLGVNKTVVPYAARFSDLSIDEINLTVRSSNGLKRANAATFGRVNDLLVSENGLLSIRNLGQKSVNEIKRLFVEECYARLFPYEKAQYWQEVLDALA